VFNLNPHTYYFNIYIGLQYNTHFLLKILQS